MRWNTRVIVVPGLPLVTGGPYRCLRHPNYVAVVVEGFALPLVHTAWVTRDRVHASSTPGCSASASAARTGRSPCERAVVTPSTSRPELDVLVVGGGPVGLGTALLARRAGLSVCVVERRAAPQDKACGEGLMPGALTALRRLGVDPQGQPFEGIRYVSADGSHAAQSRFRHGPGRGVRRTTLQDALVAAARDAGVELVRGTVEDVDQRADRVVAVGRTARYLVAADGLHSPLRRSLGLDLARTGPARYGIRQHFAMAPWSDLVEVHWAADAEAYVTPVGPAEVGVAILSGGGLSFEQLVSRFPQLLGRLGSARPTSSARGAGPLEQNVARRVVGRVLLVGDAAGYVDALTGEGIAVGLRQAEVLVGCLRRDAPAEYEQAWRSASRRYRVLTKTVLAASKRPALRRSLVPTAAALPAVFGLAVNALA